MTDLRDDTRRLFEAVMGREPDALWSAPGRVTLLGDLPEGVGALSLPIDRRVVVALALRDDHLIRVASTFGEHLAGLSLSELNAAHAGGHLEGWPALPFGVAWSFGQAGADLAAVPGVDLVIDSNIPIEAGMGSSSAVLTAVAHALHDAWHLNFSPEQIDELVRQLDDGQPPVNDELSAAFAAALHEDELSVAVIDTGRPAEPQIYADFVLASENDRAQDAAAALQHELRFDDLAPTIASSHLALRAAATGPLPELDLAVDTAYESGALVARMTHRADAVVAVIPSGLVSRLQVAIDGAFAEHGFASADVHVVAPSTGATRENL
ncbi:MAG TPA: hypothetical protein VNT53_01100 [Pseudolysinimonas sp.]|nr:hypothetical protein [Pseudolysinimonas sp.]